MAKQSSARRAPQSEADDIAVPGEETITSQVLMLARRFQGAYLDRIQNTGLTVAQARVLREVGTHPGVAQHELARKLEITKVSAGEALMRLEQTGLVRRKRCDDNRRLVRVTLTRAGRGVLKELAVAAQEQIDWLIDKVGAQKVERLNKLLLEVNDAIKVDYAVTSIE